MSNIVYIGTSLDGYMMNCFLGGVRKNESQGKKVKSYLWPNVLLLAVYDREDTRNGCLLIHILDSSSQTSKSSLENVVLCPQETSMPHIPILSMGLLLAEQAARG